MNLPRALLLLLLVTGCAMAQPHDERRGPRVVLFEHPNFQGGALVVYPGEALDNLARRTFDNGRKVDDRISSILVEGSAEVTVYTDPRFRGLAMRVTRDVRDLARGDTSGERFNDQISSLRVEERQGREGDRRPDDHGGRGPGFDPDRIVRRAYLDILEREPDAEGLRVYRIKLIDRGWTEKQVREALRTSEEYRGPYMTARLNRLYREILGRDVDPSGLQHYRDKIMNRGWSDDDVRRDLRNSSEYRNRVPSPGRR